MTTDNPQPPEDAVELSGPIEVDCPDCGGHHVILPEKVRAIMRKRRFRCNRCRRRQSGPPAAIDIEGTELRPICRFCDPGGDPE